MNRINPVYIVVLLVVILGIVVWQDHKIQKLIEDQYRRLTELEQVGQKVHALKNYWGDSKLQKKRIEEFVRFAQRFIKQKDLHNNKIKLRLEGVDAANADRLTDKLLNSFIKVGAMKVERKDKNHIDMELELVF